MSPFTSTEPSSSHEYWLLDASGRMLSHDTLADRVITRDFIPARHPGLSIWTDSPLPRSTSAEDGDNPECQAVFHKRLSLPFPLPAMIVLSIGEGLIALRQTEDRPCWLGSREDGGEVCFNAEKVTERESFLPLTQTGLAGLACLYDRNSARLRSIKGEDMGPAHFPPDAPHCLILGDSRISLAGNLDELERIGQFAPGSEHIITLHQDNTTAESQSFLIQRMG